MIKYEAVKFADRKFGVVLRLSENTSIDQRVYRKTLREAKADASMLNSEHAALNAERS
jgi:hypothetical protein